MSEKNPFGKSFGGAGKSSGPRSSRDFASAVKPSRKKDSKDPQTDDTSKAPSKSPTSKASPKGKAQSTKEKAKNKAVQTAAKSLGVPLNDKTAAKVVGALEKNAKVIGGVVAVFLMLMTVLTVTILGTQKETTEDGTAIESQVPAVLSYEVLSAYRTSALKYSAPNGTPLPWSIAAAIGAVSTEHGRFSPFDECDRFPARESSAMYPGGVPDTYTSGNCDPIRSDDEGSPVGPFLFASSYAGSDSKFLQFEYSLDTLNSEIEKAARELVAEGVPAPPATFPTSEEGIAAVDEFWAQVVARLPIVNPLASGPCQTPLVGPDPSEVAAAIQSVWDCELLRAYGLQHVVDYDLASGEYVLAGGAESIDRIISEALQVSSAWSALGAQNTSQRLCARTPLNATDFSGEVHVIGDSLTVGARDFGQLEQKLLEAGASSVRIDALTGATFSNFTNVSVNSGSTVVIALGTNSTSGGTVPFKNGLLELLEVVSPASEIYLMDIGRVYSRDVSQYNGELLAAAEANAKITYMPWSSEDLSGYYSGDNVHLNSSGYAFRSSYIADFISSEQTAEEGDYPAEAPVPVMVNGTPNSDLTPATYAGLFPLTAEQFSEHNTTPDASRCDFGPNIHAAAKLFVTGEKVSLDDRKDSNSPWKPLLGGWENFYSVSDYNFPVSGPYVAVDTSSPVCQGAIETWVSSNVSGNANTAEVPAGEFFSDSHTHQVSLYSTYTSGTRTFVSPSEWVISAPDHFAVTEILPNLTLAALDGLCGEGQGLPGETSKEVLNYAAYVAREFYSEAASQLFEDVDIEAGESGEVGDTGIDGFTIEDADQSIPRFEVTEGQSPDSIEYEAARYYAASSVLTYRATMASFGSVDVNSAQQSAALLPRFSSDGKSVPPAGEIIPMAVSASGTYSSSIVTLATKIAGLSGTFDDNRAVPDPFTDVPRLSGRLKTSSSFLAIGGVPYGLLDAVNVAVVAADELYPGCSIDAAFLLATAKAETGPWWNRIQANGQMVEPLVNSYGAKGPFQFLQETFDSFGLIVDGNGDGRTDVQNSYDAARASVKFQCGLAARYDNSSLLDPETAWQVAVDYHDGPNGGETREDCRDSGEYLKTLSTARSDCKGEVYARMRLEFADEYRALMQDMYSALESDPGYDPNSETGAIAARVVNHALAQVGKPYCKPSNQGDDNPENDCVVPVSTLSSDFISVDQGGYTLRDEPAVGAYNYRLGPDSYDCSGLAFAAYYKAGMNIGVAYSMSQFRSFDRVTGTLIPGDLLFYDWDGDGISNHVTIYVGSGVQVHAAGSKVGVIVDRVKSEGYMGASRPLNSYSPANAVTPTSDIGTRSVTNALDNVDEAIEAEIDPTLAIYFRKEDESPCPGTVLPQLYGGAASNTVLVQVPLSWFEEYSLVFERPHLAGAVHTFGVIRIREDTCALLQGSPFDSGVHEAAFDLLAHEVSHALDYHNGFDLSASIDFVETDIGHAPTSRYPERELFAFCMQRLAMGEDIRGRCPDSNYEPTVELVSARLGLSEREMQLSMGQFLTAPVVSEEQTEADSALRDEVLGGL